MSIQALIGIMPYSQDIFAHDEFESLAAWRDLSSCEPYIIDPEMIGELTSYLLDRAEPGPSTDKRYFKLQMALISAARAYRTPEGRDLIVLNAAAESSVRRRLEEHRREDAQDMLSLGIPLANALAKVDESGSVAGDLPAALEAWSKAADSLDIFLSKPRRSTRFGVDDMILHLDGLHALIETIELYRRLLLAAGRALDDLGAATIGHFKLPNLDSAVGIWHVARGDFARHIGSMLCGLALRTVGVDAAENLPESASSDGSWVLPYSRLGQHVMEWALGHSGSELNFAAVGAAWPGPAIYGYEDGEENPRLACKLLAELSAGGNGPGDSLFGSYEATVSDDLTLAVPSHLLGGDRAVYVVGRSDECGNYLRCIGESRRTSLLARLIADEQRLEDYAWGFAGGKDPADIPDDFSVLFDEEFAVLSIEGDLIELDESGRLSLGGTGFDGLEPGTSLVIEGSGEAFFITESGQKGRQNTWADEKDVSEMYFEE